MSLFMVLLQAAVAQAPATQCPNLSGLWALPDNKRIMVMEQEGCELRGTVQEPQNNVLHVRGFWRGGYWIMSATRRSIGGCGTTAWGSIAFGGPDRMLINVRGTDGLCEPDGSPGKGPAEFNATMVYTRLTPAPARKSGS